MINLEQGKVLIKLAKASISSYLSDDELKVEGYIKKDFSEVLGVFVTLNKDDELRGCIGFPEGVYPLYEGISNAARSAAFGDPRFPPLDKGEFPNITVEVSVLTKPERIEVKNAEEYLKEIKVGRDGLIVRSKLGNGLLLPQVATEYEWDSKAFLEQTCIKAGLSADSWQDIKECKVYRFQSQVFSELNPNGEVKQLI
ncbi:MAG: TIGR00296 family protein [Nanoarchaeota archaeon]|nr:TIGR00296 family protein [Nanoarchaeota archaeon]